MGVLENIVKELNDCYTEVLLTKSETTNLYFENNKFKSADNGTKSMLEIRVTKGLRSAYAWTNNINNWRECAIEAKKLMLVSSELKAKPSLSNNNINKSFIHHSIKKATPELLKEEGLKAIKSANELGVNVPSLNINKEIKSSVFINSNLNKCSEINSEIGVGIECAIGNSSSWDGKSSNGLNFDMEKLGKNTALLCKRSINPKKIKSGLYDVTIDFNALIDLLSILLPSIKANNIIEHNSLLIDKLNKQVINPLITLRDVGYIKGSPVNSVIDDEGVRVIDKDIFKNGVLKTFINDLYTAARMNEKPTGNSGGLAKRGLISTHNIVIEKGNFTKEELLNNSIYINSVMGTHTANTITGDFSLSALNAYDYKDNKPLRDVMISGNIFELLNNVTMVGNKQRIDNGFSLPLIRFKNVQLVG